MLHGCLADIFLTFGAPDPFCKSDNGAEFTAEIITGLRALWPELKFVHGKHARHPRVKDQLNT